MSYTHCEFTASFDMQCPICGAAVPGGTPHKCSSGSPSSSTPAKRKRRKPARGPSGPDSLEAQRRYADRMKGDL